MQSAVEVGSATLAEATVMHRRVLKQRDVCVSTEQQSFAALLLSNEST